MVARFRRRGSGRGSSDLLSAAVQPLLVKYVGEMLLDGIDADGETLRDLPVGHASAHQGQHLVFACGQSGRKGCSAGLTVRRRRQIRAGTDKGPATLTPETTSRRPAPRPAPRPVARRPRPSRCSPALGFGWRHSGPAATGPPSRAASQCQVTGAADRAKPWFPLARSMRHRPASNAVRNRWQRDSDFSKAGHFCRLEAVNPADAVCRVQKTPRHAAAICGPVRWRSELALRLPSQSRTQESDSSARGTPAEGDGGAGCSSVSGGASERTPPGASCKREFHADSSASETPARPVPYSPLLLLTYYWKRYSP